jgi:hypothetical protein
MPLHDDDENGNKKIGLRVKYSEKKEFLLSDITPNSHKKTRTDPISTD